ncbi:Uncharacterized conserved protein YndB, AHSA1/START domain [Reichenbachiella faecimaris]|uniref:Uncharacterized conserved protein YndB, AHSA1/START domain n=1 Tax=Reichenbachiella faecimaris TaxID=692418 RepID=A0A1W2GN67_REIFA|nr:SRPBCC domain-containing protein [Reichenbachiella faecimaris]SMD38105.1 Uncharacterized conserved protein YndB, AHSA1/START domain [Reichenbachiella faecimaris]
MQGIETILKKFSIPVGRKELFEAWISPQMTIAPITKIECNPMAGGVMNLYAESAEAVGVMNGLFEEVIPNEKLKYSWQWQGSDEQTMVTVIFKDDGLQTLVQLEHTGFLSKESYDAHNSGWDNYLDGLADRLVKS